MKRILALSIAVLLALGLTACQDERSVMGSLAEVQTDENGDLTALILERDGKRTGVLLAEKTGVWPRGEGSWTGEEAMEAFRKDLQPGNEISVVLPPEGKTGDGGGGEYPRLLGPEHPNRRYPEAERPDPPGRHRHRCYGRGSFRQ